MVTRSVDQANGCNTPTAVGTVYSSDQQVAVWFAVSDGKVGDLPSASWISPTGSVYTSNSWSSLKTAGQVCLWWQIPVASQPIASVLGVWSVRVDWNGAQLFSISFSLKAPVLSTVVNAGNFLQSAVAPGEVVVLYGGGMGPLSVATASLLPGQPTVKSLGGTSVLFDGISAPLIYASDTQIGGVVPFAISGKQAVQVQVLCNGVSTNTLIVQVQDAVPGLFSVPFYDLFKQPVPGQSRVAALNQDSTVNSPTNAASIGDVVSLFATGFGQTNPGGVDGLIATNSLPSPLLPVSASIGGVDAPVMYAGAAPYLIAGVMQINVRIPVPVQYGPSSLLQTPNPPSKLAPVVLTVGTRKSASNVYLPVVPGQPATLQTTFSPTPVNRSDDGRWYFTITLRETAGVAVTLSQMLVNGDDQTGLLAAFNGTQIPPKGQISGNVYFYCTGVGTCPLPGELRFDFVGSDEHGNVSDWRSSVHLQ
jgi:uncharacterized protein (TIGR03437 family)